MRHIVNFGLLFAFVTLSVTGLMSFVRPFSLVTTRIHIIFGIATFILVGLHLASRIPYFRQQLRSRAATHVSPRLLFLICFAWGVLLWASFRNVAPSRALIEQGYESRHRHEIVRPNPLAAAMKSREGLLAGRKAEASDTVALSLHAVFRESIQPEIAIAIWAESTAGTMIETLYVSPSLAFSDDPVWGGAQASRADILPVWRHRYTSLSGVDPSGKIDTTSGATEKHSFSLGNYMKLDADEYIVFMEVNVPGDPNDLYRNGHIGQPSVLYSALVKHSDGRQHQLMDLTGRGGGTESPGAIQYDLQGLTSAIELIEVVLITSDSVGN